mmetsp:Transcript_10702/g.30581  ORF Transcript_10702/g.30581 Transcript_10702/m.30581 type:complete len:226 (+) Transcript_10702:115-792(+)
MPQKKAIKSQRRNSKQATLISAIITISNRSNTMTFAGNEKEEDAHLTTPYGINATRVPPTQFERIEYDVTDRFCQWLCLLTCPIHWLPLVPGVMGTKTMILEEEEAVLNINCQPFCNIDTRRPYGELGSVDQHHCLCCTGVSSGLSSSAPLYVGWGCEHDRVAEIVAELKKRMKARGDTGQLAKTEEALQEIQALRHELSSMKADMKLVLRALNVPDHEMTMNRA